MIGAAIGYFWQTKRDDRQRAGDREDRKTKAQRDDIANLQLALDQFNQRLLDGLMVIHDPVRARLSGLEVGRDVPWVKEFETSDREFRVLASRIADAELETRVDRYRTVAERAIGADYSPEEFEIAQRQLLRALMDVHERAGELMKSLA